MMQTLTTPVQLTLEKIERRLLELHSTIRRETVPIPSFRYLAGDCPGAREPDFDDSAWQEFRVGESWGGYDQIAWFRADVQIPARLMRDNLALRFLVGPRDGGGSTAETMLYVNGFPLQAIDIWHEEAWLPPGVIADGEIAVALRAWSGVLDVPERRRFKVAELVAIDTGARTLYYLADTIWKTLQQLDPRDWRHVAMLEGLEEALALIEWRRPRSPEYYRSVHEALARLQELSTSWQALERQKPTVTAVGHAHLDLAWLWRYRHSREKVGRTFATALHLMRQYPEYRFMHSSPQIYKELERDHPEIFAQVRERVKSGEWEITGGMWVEADVNLPSGESLVRQLLFGRRYIREKFGKESKVVWLPDVFGYSPSLPQIMLRSGIEYFTTTKISWSQFNRFPYDTFRWRGIDGSEILTHFITTPEEGTKAFTYNGQLEPRDVKGLWDNYQQKDVNDELLQAFGWGDGGGGPTREMLEAARAMCNLPGLPKVELGHVEPYFERLGERLAGEELAVWDGELYLEYHRGTYTSQGRTKRNNRRAEDLFQRTELLASTASLLAGHEYPQLGDAWELLLLNQFHDVLPGSSIREVYEDTDENFGRIFAAGEEAFGAAAASLGARLAGERDRLLLINPLPFEAGGLVEVPAHTLAGRPVLDRAGSPLPSQRSADGESVLVAAPAVPALGYLALELGEEQTGGVPVGEEPLRVSAREIVTPFYRITLDERGAIASLFDRRANRQVLAPGARGNVLQAFEDKPLKFDAWDIDLYYQEKMREVSDLVEAVVEESGPLRGVLRLTWRHHDSTVTQRLTVHAGDPRIDFVTHVDWQESQTLLKVAFPLNVRANRATFDMQFGSVERPTHWNTSWDWARFEVVAHKWADLSEGNYGAALLNDCKYGYDVKDNVMRLTLIKSPISPDPLADKGEHVFTYSLLPHQGTWREGGVLQQGYRLNRPLLPRLVPASPGAAPAAPREFSFVSSPSEHVVVETVKRAEDQDGWIVRVYEAKQFRSTDARLVFGRRVARAVECNLMEEGAQAVVVEGDGQGLRFAIDPFEIKTFRVWFAE